MKKQKGAQDESTTLSPEKGFRAWLIVFAGFCVMFIVTGLPLTFGVIVPTFAVAFAPVNLAQISAVATIQFAIMFGGGLIAGPAADHLGSHIVICFGALLWFAGMITISFTSSYGVLIFSFGILVGFGSALCYWSVMTTIPQWFPEELRFPAIALAQLGGGAGQLVFALGIAPYLQDLNIWRQTFQIIAGVGGGVLFLSGLVIRRRLKHVHKHDIKQQLKELLFHDRNYIVLILTCLFVMFGLYVPFVDVVPYMRSKDLSNDDANQVMAVIAGMSMVGRLSSGIAAKRLGSRALFRISSAICTISMFAWLVCTTRGDMIAFGVFFGIGYGGVLVMPTVLSAEYWGVEKLGVTMSLPTLALTPGAAASATISGAIFDSTGSFYDAIVYAGVMFAASFIVSLFFTLPKKSTKGISKELVETDKSATVFSSSNKGGITAESKAVTLTDGGEPDDENAAASIERT